jgi:hypothetical protein
LGSTPQASSWRPTSEVLSGDEIRWRLYAVYLDEFAWHCPDCAEREFGDD